MAKRHESLIPLSQDHYHGLLLVQQIRTTDRTMISGWPDEPVKQANFVVEFYNEHLIPHFQAEEQSLFPLVLQYVPRGKKQVEGLLNEHRRVLEFVEGFKNPKADLARKQLTDFATLLEGHIRKEERELFPLFESEAPPEVLNRAKHLLRRSPDAPSSHS
ncbi:MAG: hemerythrin domain-containing protein [Ignavibacteriales bacterium]|nr:hemerythrin domain-containing protein [Ignavibacteriales bacterium]